MSQDDPAPNNESRNDRENQNDRRLSGRALIHVERAMGDLRRGLPVLIANGTGEGVLALPVELVTEQRLSAFRELVSGTPAVALTARRAAVIHVAAMGPEGVLIKLDSGMEAATVRALADPVQDLARPMMGPFRQADMALGPVQAAAIQLCKHAQLLPSAIVATVKGDIQAFARNHDILCVAAAEVAAYGPNTARSLVQVVGARVPLHDAENARIIAFRPENGSIEHLAVVIGDPPRRQPVLARIHSECFTGDLVGSMKCDCGEQLRGAIREIEKEGGGVLLYLAQEGRGIGLMNKLRAYQLQDQGFDTVEANERLGFEADERLFLPAAEMLRGLGFSKVRLMTNNPAKVAGLEACGIEVTERVEHIFPSNAHNEFYLLTKKKRSGHYL